MLYEYILIIVIIQYNLFIIVNKSILGCDYGSSVNKTNSVTHKKLTHYNDFINFMWYIMQLTYRLPKDD